MLLPYLKTVFWEEGGKGRAAGAILATGDLHRKAQSL